MSGNPNDPDEVDSQGEPIYVSPLTQLENRVKNQIATAQSDFEKFTKGDAELRLKDTIEVCVDILGRIKGAATEINELSESEREKLYYLTFNATVLIFKICCKIRVAGFPKQATHFLAFNMLCLDNNLILTTVKYLHWRVLNYVELARAYGDLQAYKAALKVVTYGINKVLYSKKIEEQDPPVPDGNRDSLIEALRIMRTHELKYQVLAGVLKPDEWKKKVTEVFSVNKYHRSLAIVECLALNDTHNANLVQRNAALLQTKTSCLQGAVEMLKPEIDLVKEALVQIHLKKKRDKEKKEKLQNLEKDVDLDELLEQYKTQDAEMIKEKEWKAASTNVPIEVHVELIKLCFEAKMWDEFDALLDPALVRLKFRRYEVPYLATVDIAMAHQKIANIPNGFEKVPKDLNAANLRIELKKLRAESKQQDIDSDENDNEPSSTKAPQAQAAAAAKKEEPAKGKAPAKVDPKAAAAAGKGKGKEAVQETKDFETIDQDAEDEIVASQKELDIIKHIYVSMLLQRTKNPKNAIVGIDVVMADETIGPELPENHYAVAVPIRQHVGVYEQTKLIPYIVFRRTANTLLDEEDCLSIVTDVKVLMGQDRLLQAPLGYTKIPIDLRQTPADLERVPNLDYVFVCYKSDKQINLVERDLLIFRRVAELERSYTPKSSPEFKALTEQNRFLMTNYNLECLAELSKIMRESLSGPLGEYYLEERRDIMNDICQMIYSQFLLPVLQKIDSYVEMRNQKEFFGEFVDTLDEHVIKVKNQFVDAFGVIHSLMSREVFITNIIMYGKLTVYFANLLEDSGDFKSGVEGLRVAIKKIISYREDRMKHTLDSQDSATCSMGITIDNKKICDMELKIRNLSEKWKELICRKERDRERRDAEIDALSEDEGDEEQNEVRLCEKELHKKDLFEKNIDEETWYSERARRDELKGKKFFTEQDQIVHAIHTDLLMCLYRCEIKLGKEMKIMKKQSTMLTQMGSASGDLYGASQITAGSMNIGPNSLTKNTQNNNNLTTANGMNTTKGLSKDLQKKMNMKQTSKTLAGTKKAFKELQHTLQEANKLPPAKPQILSYEKLLEKENNKNPYANALLYMSLAVAKGNSVAQKALLLEALDHCKKAKQNEDQMTELALENAVNISASRNFHSYYERSPDQVHPYNLLAKPLYIKKTPVPATPVMIARTSTTITMKLPFYKPITEYKAWRNIETAALYGKPSGSGVAVSLNNTDYEGTGKKCPPGHIVHVKGLIPNEKYVFAAGCYTPDGICVNGIGETCKEILTVLPLSLHQIQGYLAEIAFKLGHYQISKHVAESVCSQFCIKNEFKYPFLDARVNPVLALRLNTDYINLISPIESKQIAESFIILAKVSKIVRNEVQRRALTNELKVENQKMDLRIANYLVIALDIGTMLQRPILIKRVVCELFNHLASYLQMSFMSPLLMQILVRCHQAVRLIPFDLMDAATRKILSCISFQIMRLGFQTNEEKMLKVVMISELPLVTRKWRKYGTYVIQKDELTEEQKLIQADQRKKIANGEEVKEEDLVRDPETTEEKHLKIFEFEQEGRALDEFMLSMSEYTDVVKAKTEKWHKQISTFAKQLTDGEQVVEKEKSQLTGKVDFWDAVNSGNPITQLNSLCDAANAEGAPENANFIEFCCKCVRRAMELPETDLNELAQILVDKVTVSEEVSSKVISILGKRIEHLDNDVVTKQRTRFELLETRVKELLEERALSGGNTQMNARQLKRIMAETEQSVANLQKDTETGNQMVRFDSIEQRENYVDKFLWISEKFFLQGVCLFVGVTKTSPPKNLSHQVQPQNAIFNDILRLDFTKFKAVLAEHQQIKKEKAAEEEAAQKLLEAEQKQKEDGEESKGEDVTSSKPIELTEEQKLQQDKVKFLEVMANAASFALNSRSWLQLLNIILYVWNSFTYDMTTPLEVTDTSAWHSVVVLAECSLFLLEHLQKGGKLRKLAGKEIDKVPNQKARMNKDARQVGFRFDQGEDNNEQIKIRDDAPPEGGEGSQPGRESNLSVAKSIEGGPMAAGVGSTTGLANVRSEDQIASKPSILNKKEQENPNEESKMSLVSETAEAIKQVEPGSEETGLWYDLIDEFDMTTQASFVAFALQCLMSVSKWESMVDLSNRLNKATEMSFATQLLPFIIFAETTLFQQAADSTASKKRELEARIQAFENWKATSKKKRSRAASITGEIPQEEKDFNEDKANLEKEVFRLEVIENVLLSDKDYSIKQLEGIKSEANQCVEALKACRKLYFQYGVETENLKLEEIRKGTFGEQNIQNHEIRSKRKSHKVFTNMVIASYNKCIKLLRKKQEKFLLIQCLHELGNLLYADDQLSEAEIQWNDCVDTIFQKLYVVSSFREVFKENPQLADAFGSRQVIIGGIVLSKLAKLIYEGKDMHRFQECITMASEMLASPAKLSLPHAQTPIEYHSYTFREFLNGRCAGDVSLFEDKQIVSPSELISALQTVGQALADQDLFHKTLPLFSLLEYLAAEVTLSSVLVVKARIQKANSLLELGYINEALLIYKRILGGHDIPKYGVRKSEHQEKHDGSNFKVDLESSYRNDLSPDSEENLAALDFISKELGPEETQNLKKFCSPSVLEALRILRSLFLIRLSEQENVQNADKAANRAERIALSESSLRQSLKNLSLIYEISDIKQQLSSSSKKDKQEKSSLTQMWEEKLAKAFEKGEISDADQGSLYKNTEEEMCFADMQCQTLSMILRTRLLLGRLFRKQGLLISGFYALRQGLKNFLSLAEGQTADIEKGNEDKDKGSFELPEIYGGNGVVGGNAAADKGAKGKAAPAKAPAKAAGKGKGGGAEEEKSDEQLAAEKEQERVRNEQRASALKELVQAQNRRKHPSIFLWLKTKIEIITILLWQNRTEDVSDSIAVARMETLSINDKLFVRKLDEIDFMVSVKQGQIDAAMFKADQIRAHAKEFSQSDLSYAEFLGNLSELLFKMRQSDEACKVIKEGRLIAWYRLRDQGIEIDQQNINASGNVFVKNDGKGADDATLDKFSSIQSTDPKAKGGKKEEKKKEPAKAQQHETVDHENEDDEDYERPVLDFKKPIKTNIELNDATVNSSQVPPNIYLESLNLAIRFDVRYAQLCCVLQQKYELSRKVLKDTEKLVKRTLFVSPQLQFYTEFLAGLADKCTFIEQVIQYQSRYQGLRKYKSSLTDHIPAGQFALGQYLIELPNFSQKLREELIAYLESAKASFERAIQLGKQECIVYEFDCTLCDAVRSLAEIEFYLGEYRQRSLEYKYAAYADQDKARKQKRLAEKKAEQASQNDNLNDNGKDLDQNGEDLEGGDKWEEQKLEKEALAIYNHKKASCHYMRTMIQISQNLRLLQDSAHTIGGTGQLTEAAKIPREVVSELFEASQNNKIMYAEMQGFEFKDKTSIAASEIVSYLKAILLENGLFTFGEDRLRNGKLISKLHRYLNANLAAYKEKVTGDLPEYQPTTDVSVTEANELLKNGENLIAWNDIRGENSEMLYILGPLEEAAFTQKEEDQKPPATNPTPTSTADAAAADQDKQTTEVISEKAAALTEKEEKLSALKEAILGETNRVHFGKMTANPTALSQLHQDIRDLGDKMRLSEKLSEAQNERDRKGYQVEFEKLIDRLGGFFKPAVISEEELEKDVDCLALVKQFIPELTVDNVLKLSEILRHECGSTQTDPNYNAIMRSFHRIRYAL